MENACETYNKANLHSQRKQSHLSVSLLVKIERERQQSKRKGERGQGVTGAVNERLLTHLGTPELVAQSYTICIHVYTYIICMYIRIRTHHRGNRRDKLFCASHKIVLYQ